MDFGDVDSSHNPQCTCGDHGVQMISPVEKAIQCMRDENVEVVEKFRWEPYFVVLN